MNELTWLKDILAFSKENDWIVQVFLIVFISLTLSVIARRVLAKIAAGPLEAIQSDAYDLHRSLLTEVVGGQLRHSLAVDGRTVAHLYAK